MGRIIILKEFNIMNNTNEIEPIYIAPASKVFSITLGKSILDASSEMMTCSNGASWDEETE